MRNDEEDGELFFEVEVSGNGAFENIFYFA